MQRPWTLKPQLQLHPNPSLTFAPLAWLKLAFFCHLGDTEIGGFGISSKEDLLYVEDFVTIRQQATEVSVYFLDEAVADHFDTCVEQGLAPQRCGRIWIHTHPGTSAVPSGTDEETFEQSFGSCDWAVMAILACGGQTYARVAFNVGPKAQVEIPVQVDWSALPAALASPKPALGSLDGTWRQEFDTNVQIIQPAMRYLEEPLPDEPLSQEPWWDPELWAFAKQPNDFMAQEKEGFLDSRDRSPAP
jgi:proteasome lid subunit RPN8/RPN11